MTPTPSPLALTTLRRSFGDRLVVDIANLTLEPGEIMALLGPSGCGKSTTLRLIAGLDHADSGEIAIAGRTVASDRTFVPPQKRGVGMVFQDHALFPHLTVQKNVGYGLRRGERDRIAEMLALVGLPNAGDAYPRELSGGQQQRVALARALAPHPSLLLLDEPFSSLDPALRQRLREEVRAIIKQAGATALMVTHDQEEAFSMADRVAVMLDGRIVQVGTPDAIYLQPETPAVASFVGDINLLPGMVTASGITSPLGTLSLATDQRGPVLVAVRPEAIELAPIDRASSVISSASGSVSGGVSGIVISTAFTGHDQVLGVRVEGRHAPILVRQRRTTDIMAGDRVCIIPPTEGIVFPACDGRISLLKRIEDRNAHHPQPDEDVARTPIEADDSFWARVSEELARGA